MSHSDDGSSGDGEDSGDDDDDDEAPQEPAPDDGEGSDFEELQARACSQPPRAPTPRRGLALTIAAAAGGL